MLIATVGIIGDAIYAGKKLFTPPELVEGGRRLRQAQPTGGVNVYAGKKAYKRRRKQQTTSLISSLTDTYQQKQGDSQQPTISDTSTTFVQTIRKLAPFSGGSRQDLRQAQMQEMSSIRAMPEKSDAEKLAELHIGLSVIALGLTTAGHLFFPPLRLLGMACLLYGWRYLLRKAYKSLFVERRMSVEVIDCFFLPIALIFGYDIIISIADILFFSGEKILLKTEDQSTKSLINVFGEQPRTVWILKDDTEISIPFEQLQADDNVVVSAGEMIPIDGVISDGIASVDQRILTGESQPVEKGIGSQVFASTVVISGRVQIRTEKTGQETTAAQIGQILNQTKDFKSYIRSQAVERVDKMVPMRFMLIAISLPLLGVTGGLAVLGARFGSQMRITGPLGMLNFLQIASHNGILVKDGRSLEQLSKVDTVVFDKTGTLTEEQPSVGTIFTCNGYHREDVLANAATAESRQTHPIALAILAEAKKHKLDLAKTSDVQYEVGYGIQVSLAERLIQVGSNRFMQMEGITIPPEIQSSEHQAHKLGYSIVYVAIERQLAGAIELRPTVRPEAKEIVQYLKQRQINTYIISGDHEKPTQILAEQLGIEHYFAETLPENKAALVEQLQSEGKFVCFVGDGINDSIALKKADVSISLSGASTIATDTAQIILMDKTLNQLTYAFGIADDWETNMRGAFLYSMIPQTITVLGAYFLGFGIISSLALNLIGLSMGVRNAMLPLYQHQNRSKQA